MSTKIGRPGADEYAPYYETYVGKVKGEDPIAVLKMLRHSTEEILSRVDEATAAKRYESGKWSVKEVIGHISDAERVFALRMVWFSRQPDSELPGFDQNVWVPASKLDTVPLAAVVDAWRAQRDASITLCDTLPSSTWTNRGTASGKIVSVRALAFISAGHEIHHLGVLKERYGVQ